MLGFQAHGLPTWFIQLGRDQSGQGAADHSQVRDIIGLLGGDRGQRLFDRAQFVGHEVTLAHRLQVLGEHDRVDDVGLDGLSHLIVEPLRTDVRWGGTLAPCLRVRYS